MSLPKIWLHWKPKNLLCKSVTRKAEKKTWKMNSAIAAVSAHFATWISGGSPKCAALIPMILKFPFSSSSPQFSRGRCGEALGQRVGSGSFNEVLVQRIGDKNVAEAVRNILEMVPSPDSMVVSLLKVLRDEMATYISINFSGASRSSSRREILHTDFLTPPVLKESISSLEKLTDVKTVAQGGYPQAERCRISIGDPQILTTDPDVVAALSIFGNFGFEHCSHGDFLGAIIGTGIAREKVGDILLQGKEGAQVLVVPELVEFLTSALNKVGNVSVSCQRIPLLALEYEPPRTKSFTTVEASLRVDAIASAGFSISRSKLVSLISNGDVRLNWSPVIKNGAMLKTGDIVSVSGKGRLKIGEIKTTRKGKFSVELIRYL